MTSMDRFDKIKREFPTILKSSLGIISDACKKAGISRETYYNWRRASPEFAALCDEAEIITGSVVKDMLMKRILAEDTAAIIFYCKTKLRKDGYAEKVDVGGQPDNPIKHTHNFDITKYDKDTIDALMRIKGEG